MPLGKSIAKTILAQRSKRDAPIPNGTAKAMTTLVKQGDTLILQGTHIQGSGTLKEALAAARIYAKERGFGRIIIESGERTTGLTKGRTPRPIIIETGLKSR